MSNSKLTIIFGIMLFSAIPLAHAAMLSFQPQSPTVQLNVPFAVDVMLDPQNQSVNATEGEIVFPPSYLTLEGVYEGNSIVNLWIQKPQETSSGTIGWSGIMPGGFSGVLKPGDYAPSAGLLFTLVFKPLEPGQGTMSWNNTEVLLNNGQGTAAAMTALPLVVNISTSPAGAAAPPSQITNDHNPPDPFKITLARDPNIFGGQWFISFNAVDKETGIASYGVLESLFSQKSIGESEWRIITSPYPLRDQSLSSYVYVRAVDYAGNARIAVLPPTHPVSLSTVLIYASAIIVIAIAAISWFIKKRKTK